MNTAAQTVTLTRAQVLDLFRREMHNSADPLLVRSFSRYADRRDQLAALYQQVFGIVTAQELQTQLAIDTFLLQQSAIAAQTE